MNSDTTQPCKQVHMNALDGGCSNGLKAKLQKRLKCRFCIYERYKKTQKSCVVFYTGRQNKLLLEGDWKVNNPLGGNNWAHQRSGTAAHPHSNQHRKPQKNHLHPVIGAERIHIRYKRQASSLPDAPSSPS